MLSRTGRPLSQVLFGPIARLCVKAHISADAVTIVGTLAGVIAALTLFPFDHLTAGAWTVGVLVIFDNLDGQIARITGTASKWGAFLDSTLDRVSDGAIFSGILVWAYLWADPSYQAAILIGTLGALVFGAVVPYARARAEGLGMNASVGLAERADRLVISLVAAWFVGMEWGDWIMAVAMWLLFIGAVITVVQRMMYVYKQANDHSNDLPKE
ncbi:MAG: phosphatidylinositol phosphate synthase [Ancrocorticia sp.]|uniref:phosphatidylinositol phosphate synthase n=1 Tax=Ancrocorticia sp. TaxID=2593684 RepID=UPI003F8F6389